MPFKVNVESSILDFIHEIQDPPEKLDMVNVNDLLCVCLYIKNTDSKIKYIVDPVNIIENE